MTIEGVDASKWERLIGHKSAMVTYRAQRGEAALDPGDTIELVKVGGMDAMKVEVIEVGLLAMQVNPGRESYMVTVRRPTCTAPPAESCAGVADGACLDAADGIEAQARAAAGRRAALARRWAPFKQRSEMSNYNYITSRVTVGQQYADDHRPPAYDAHIGFDTDGQATFEAETPAAAAIKHAKGFWERLDPRPTVIILVLCPDESTRAYLVTWDYPMFSDRDPAQGDKQVALTKKWPF